MEMDLQDIDLTRVTATDLKTLQDLSEQTFSETFAWGNTKENLEIYLQTGFDKEKLNNEINNPDSEFYFAKFNNIAIGYLKVNVGKAQTELREGKGLEIERIYVLKAYQGNRIGQLLFDKALQLATQYKVEYLWLGVWEKNLNAITFYERNGLIPFGSHIFKIVDDEQIDILMRLEV